jgi:hypothetical protein
MLLNAYLALEVERSISSCTSHEWQSYVLLSSSSCDCRLNIRSRSEVTQIPHNHQLTSKDHGLLHTPHTEERCSPSLAR